MLDFHKLLTRAFWFTINPYMIDRSDRLLFEIAGGMIVFAIVFKIAEVYSPSPVDSRFRRRFFNLFLTTGILELIWYWFRDQDVNLFGTHAMAFLVLLIWLIWLGAIAVDIWKNYSREKSDWEKTQARNKYLPV